MIVEGAEYRRINFRRLEPGQSLKIPSRWDGLRALLDSESKTHHRIIFAAGVIGLIVGMAGALIVNQIILAIDSGSADAVRQGSIEPAITAFQAKPHGEDGAVAAAQASSVEKDASVISRHPGPVVGDARQDDPASVQVVSRLHVTGADVNLRSGPSTEKSAITKLEQGTDLIEIERSRDWIQVEIPSLKGKRGWIHQSLVEHGTFKATLKINTASADDTPRSTEAGLGLASDGRCRRALSGDKSSINCFQRGDDDGVPDKALDTFQNLIKLKKYNCDESIDAASYVKEQKGQIYLVQCGRGPRYRVEIIGDDLKVQPIEVN